MLEPTSSMLDAEGGRPPHNKPSEIPYKHDDQSTVGLVMALICGVGSIFICFAFVAICYRFEFF